MIKNETELVLIQLVRANLPPSAELLMLSAPAAEPTGGLAGAPAAAPWASASTAAQWPIAASPQAAILQADLTGDGQPEIAAAYRINGESHVLVLGYYGNSWQPIAHLKGPGYGISLLSAAPITARGRSNLIVGWQAGAIWSKLSVYEWTPQGMKDIAPADMNYGYREIEDMPSTDHTGQDGIAEIALWIHDTGEAYQVEVLRWERAKGISEFVPALDVYPYYFRKVAHYYETLTRQHPDYAFYWYYLADAQYKAGLPQAAAASLEVALSLQQPYPSKDALQHLQQLIQLQLAQRRMPELRAGGLFPAHLKTITGTKWGFIDSKGDWLIGPQFEYANDFQESGFAVVQANGLNGIIDATGKYVVPPIYDSISPFSEGRAVVIDKQGFKVIDQKGRVLTGKPYSYIAPYSNGRAAFTKAQAAGGSQTGSELYGYLDLSGKEAIPAKYLQAGDFRDGKAVVQLKAKEFALIRPDGKRITMYPYAFVGALGNGLLPFQKEASGKYGYINERGKIIISPQYTMAFAFEDGAAVVNMAEDYGSLYGLVDRDANFLIKPIYDVVRPLGEQRVALGKAIDPKQPFIGSNYAIADINGKLLTDFQYQDVSDYKQGLASVTNGSQTFFIDLTGKAATGYPRLEGSGTLAIMNELIQANVDQRLSYLDRSGHVVWRTNTVIPLRPPFRVKEHKYKPNKDYLVYYPQVEGMNDPAAEQQVNERLMVLSQVKNVPNDVQLDYSYTGDYEVAFFQKNLLELKLEGYHFPFGAAHGMPTRLYTTTNLVNGHSYGLSDLFKSGSNYVQVLSAIVAEQIKEDPQYDYVFPDTYKGIKADQPFYVTGDALHLYFEPYEIAPYVAGFPTFTIPFSSIMNIIAVNGEFWRAFQPIG
ncbi:WG repeat-containing protein [Paenibacillus agricola]|uniref:DUF3298 domain-containing protein n=1 Tax=Paenibacillus agricola TaxID=2716264 RepID=A0ABX0JKJ1_9BACL|nr:WG repeat-containing protein [Paenibacillus agricola]NHN34571.1 DUF3298 domain-containing protein [Paenibacillus agricola]